jgi:predicted RNase H-like HicB family nuclease
MLYRYPVAIEIGDDKVAWGVVVPDLPGVFSAGDSLDEALENAEDAILLALEDLIGEGKEIPTPSGLEWMMVGKDGKGGPKKFPRDKWGWFIVNVDTSKLTAKAVRINITLPEPLLKLTDKYTADHPGSTRSGLIANALQRYLHV